MMLDGMENVGSLKGKMEGIKIYWKVKEHCMEKHNIRLGGDRNKHTRTNVFNF